ncbi:MAG: ABC transporter ATP-binding protein [Chitinophagales bacterium]|nr:ABC transporter ATP-binding protein [Chitinophagales bacterium]
MSAESIIRLQHLSKHFGNFEAVNDLNLEVKSGDVFGFLGPNGAGKSTTIRMMLSLIKPTAGNIFIFGKNLFESRSKILKRIGCIVEKPDFYLYLSAEKNLELFGKLSGIIPSKNKIAELIELVGLKGRAKDKVKTYSHGMKQRLGLAQTLIHDPELIIVDEPTTGLDPQGIIDVRQLILRLKNDFRKTVLLSSHQLNEVEQIATRMAIINKGKTIVQGEVSELLSTSDLIVSVEVGNVEGTKQLIQNSSWISKLKLTDNSHMDFNISKEEISALTKFLVERDVRVFSVHYKRTLEDYFLKLTNQQNLLTNR